MAFIIAGFHAYKLIVPQTLFFYWNMGNFDVYGDINLVGHVIKSHKAQMIYSLALARTFFSSA